MDQTFQTCSGAGDYVDKICAGEACDSRLSRPTKFDLIVNLKTAKALEIDISPALLARADELSNELPMSLLARLRHAD